MSGSPRGLVPVIVGGFALGLGIFAFYSGGNDVAGARLEAAVALLDEGKIKEGQKALEASLQIDGDHAPTHLKLGQVHLANGRAPQALTSFQRSLALEEDPEAWLGLARAEMNLGDLQAGEASLRQGLERSPENGPLRQQLGVNLAFQDQPHLAVEAFSQAARSGAAATVESSLFWGRALEALGDGEGALAQYQVALELQPTPEPGLLLTYGARLAQQPGRVDEGLQAVNQALALAPSDPVALARGGDVYFNLGRNRDALSLFERALIATPEASPLRGQLAAAIRDAQSKIESATAPADAPNVLMILVDTLRADHLGAYGYPRPTSPTIDALAKGGLLFEVAYSQAPWTAASVASLFTGLFPSVHGIDSGASWSESAKEGDDALPFAVQSALGPGQLTLAEVFRDQGFSTGAFVSNAYLSAAFGFSQGFDIYDDSHRDYMWSAGHIKRRGSDTNKSAFEWLDTAREAPFFLFVHYNDPHWPYIPPAPHGQEWVRSYKGSLTPETTIQVVETLGAPVKGLSEADLAYLIGLYDGEIHYVDEVIKGLLAKAREASGERELITVLVADHGEEFLDHGSASHGYTLYEEQLHVPFILHSTKGTLRGRVPNPVRMIDVMPTLVALAGLQEGHLNIQGQSLVPLIGGDPSQAPPFVFAEAAYQGELKAFRTPKGEKIIEGEEGSEVFDLKADPREQRDLAKSDTALRDRLAGALAAQREVNDAEAKAMGLVQGQREEVVMDRGLEEQLKALGYLGE